MTGRYHSTIILATDSVTFSDIGNSEPALHCLLACSYAECIYLDMMTCCQFICPFKCKFVIINSVKAMSCHTICLLGKT